MKGKMGKGAATNLCLFYFFIVDFSSECIHLSYTSLNKTHNLFLSLHIICRYDFLKVDVKRALGTDIKDRFKFTNDQNELNKID